MDTYNKSYVAFLDILGFKEIVNNNSHEELIEMFNFVIKESFSQAIDNFNDDNKWDGIFSGEEFKIESIIVSDSIILWTKNGTSKSFVKLISVVHVLLAYSIGHGLALRGGISFGSLTSDIINGGKTVFGKALTQAYLVESSQNWAGCIVDNNAIDEFKKQNNGHPNISKLTIGQLLNTFNILAYHKVPKKSGEIEEDVVINWPQNPIIHEYVTPDFIRNCFSKYKKSTDNWKVENLIRNTTDFFESSREKNSKE